MRKPKQTIAYIKKVNKGIMAVEKTRKEYMAYHDAVPIKEGIGYAQAYQIMLNRADKMVDLVRLQSRLINTVIDSLNIAMHVIRQYAPAEYHLSLDEMVEEGKITLIETDDPKVIRMEFKK